MQPRSSSFRTHVPRFLVAALFALAMALSQPATLYAGGQSKANPGHAGTLGPRAYANQFEGAYIGDWETGSTGGGQNLYLIVGPDGTITGTIAGLKINPNPPPVYTGVDGPLSGTVSSTTGALSMVSGSPTIPFTFTGTIAPYLGLMQGYGSFSGGGLTGTWHLFITSPTLTLLDANYRFSHVNLADTNLSSIGSAEIATLTTDDTQVCGTAVADGATKILLEYIAPSAGTVNFSEPQGYSANGDVLETINGSPNTSAVPTQLVNGNNVAFALYKTPDSLPSVTGGLTNPVQFEAKFAPAGGAFGAYSPASLKLVDPPVVFIHGFASDPLSWLNTSGTGPLYSVFAAGLPYSLVDYRTASLNTFASNQTVLLMNTGGIQEALTSYRSEGWAITKVDVVGHSMGGLLTRELSMWPNYKCLTNFYSGFVHHLITIGTPHLGSKAASYVVNFATGPVGPLFITTLQKFGWPYGGAFSDLAYGSPAILNISNINPIPSYAIAGQSNIPNSDPKLTGLYNLLSFINVMLYRGPTITPATVFPGELSDLVVGATSAAGGLPSQFAYTAPTSADHLQESESSEIGTKVAALLTGPASAFNPNGFAPPSSVPYVIAAPVPPNAKAGVTAATAPFLTITSPIAGHIFQPGATMTVTLTPVLGTTLSAAAVSLGPPDGIVGTHLFTGAPFSANFTIPTNYIGDLPINVMAGDTTGRICLVSSDCSVRTTATVSSLKLSASVTTFSVQGATTQLAINGLFSDGVTRDITKAVTGTTYLSSNSAVLTISPDGLVTAAGNGSTQITVTNGTASKTGPVLVSFAAPDVLMVSPGSGGAGVTVPLSITGYGLRGATGVQLYLNGVPDTNITAGNVVVDSGGSSLTATVTIGHNAIHGIRTVVVTTPAGQSDPLAAPDAAGFTVSSPTADFNGDGKADLVLQSATTNQVAAWLMNGPTLLGGQYISLTPGAGWKVAGEGDFNGDGKTDLVLQNTSLNKAAIWYLNGTAFVTGQYVSANIPAGWTIVAVGDFNGDGKPDIVLQNATTGQVAFWYMNGATVTGGAYVSSTPAAGWRVAGAGDFNADGKTDLVLQNSTTNQVALWYLNGATLIGGAYTSSTPPAGYAVVGVGDFNGDGKPDLVLQNAANNQVAFWYINGAAVSGGAFANATPGNGWHVVGPR